MIGVLMLVAAAFASASATPPAPVAPDPTWRETPSFLYIPPQVHAWDYPPDALEAEAEGLSLLRLEIAADNTVQSCTVIRSAGRPSMDAQACRLWQRRGRFKLREGVKTPVIAQAPVYWRLAEALPNVEAEPN